MAATSRRRSPLRAQAGISGSRSTSATSKTAACRPPATTRPSCRRARRRSASIARGPTWSRETVGTSVSAYVPARGVKSVTFYLDGRKLVTVTKPSHRRFSVTIDARKLGFGVHRLTTKVAMRGSDCASAALAGSFIHVKPSSLPPHSPAEAVRAAVSRLHIYVARLLPLGLGIGALALGPGAAAGAGRASPSARDASVSVALSNGRTISRWAYAHTRPSSGKGFPTSATGGPPSLPDRGRPGRSLYGPTRDECDTDGPDLDRGLAPAASQRRDRLGRGERARPAPHRRWAPRDISLAVSRDAVRPSWACGLERPRGHRPPSLPTPAGHFYVREKLRAIDSPEFGPYAIGTSAYAPKLSEWPGGGIIGIHGTNEPQLIPGNPSHGCVRMRNPDITACGTSSRSARRSTSPEDNAQSSPGAARAAGDCSRPPRPRR